jgi:geranylgeranyl diphosphate synthase type I
MINDQTLLVEKMQLAITHQLQRNFADFLSGYPDEYRRMAQYQLGLESEKISSGSQGKRLRPLFVLLTCDFFGGDWRRALPAAAGVELLHNFSLVHDDIQDGSETRRGRESIWKVWGIPQAINTGDALLNLAYLSVEGLRISLGAQAAAEALFVLQRTCLELTGGQYLDMAFETAVSVPLELYWQMIDGKTAALLGTCFKLGAMAAGVDFTIQQEFLECGRLLGLAFQVQDDFLGVWGDESQTGKPVFADLLSRKKTYPVLLGLENNKRFAAVWASDEKIELEDARQLADYLEDEGIKEKTAAKYRALYSQALQILENRSIIGNSAHPLIEIVRSLECRKA